MMTDPQHIVATVTGNDLLQRLDSVSSSLAKIETKVDSFPTEMAASKIDTAQLQIRVSKLENWKSWQMGIMTTMSLLLTSGVITALFQSVRK